MLISLVWIWEGLAGRGGKKDGKVCACVQEGGRFGSIKETGGRVR